MRVALIVDAYQPFRSSAAIQMGDLANEFVIQGHEPIVITPAAGQMEPWTEEISNGVRVWRLSAPQTKNIGRIRRAFAELVLPFFMIWNLRKSPIKTLQLNGIIWYSPTIFFGPLVHYLKFINKCKTYLILRDIFPDITIDLGILKRGLIYKLFKVIEFYQYSLANTIGVQSESNIEYLLEWSKRGDRNLEVLHNWQAVRPILRSNFFKNHTSLIGKKILVYAGNMGVMQGFDIVLKLADRLQQNHDVAILLVGRGTEVSFLKMQAEKQHLKNVFFHDEIDPSEVPGMLAMCHIGLILLDPRLKTHNIPGKLISYMQAEIPVLARINSGNDLYDLINENQIGHVHIGDEIEPFLEIAQNLINDDERWKIMSANCKVKVVQLFSSITACKQIYSRLNI
ncbi:MAG: glycosyltransferase family 4 protein [Methylococcales bacterium]